MTDPDVVITLAGEPKGKGRGRAAFSKSIHRVVVFTPSDTRQYETNLKYAAQKAMSERAPFTGCVALSVYAYRSIPASFSKKKHQQALDGILRPAVKPDCDNIIKMLDALNKVVFMDDAQVVDAHIHKFYSDRPRLVIGVWDLSKPASQSIKQNGAADGTQAQDHLSR